MFKIIRDEQPNFIKWNGKIKIFKACKNMKNHGVCYRENCPFIDLKEREI